MDWIALSIFVLGTTYFAIQYRGFRRGLLLMLLGLVALAAVGGIYSYFHNLQQDQRRQVALSIIAPNQIELAEAALSLGVPSEMKAVVANNSPHQLAELAVRVTVMDCPAKVFDKVYPPQTGDESVKKGDPWAEFRTQGAKCAAVGQDVARHYGLNVPSGQKRAFRGYVRFDNLPPLKPNEWSWRYSIVEIVASH
ncbi:MAG: hypothetical protein AB7F78_06995 [Hyphomicrobiaceae bacterium]